MENRVLLPDNVDPVHYDLHISTKLDGDYKFSGEVTVELNISKTATKCLKLHGKELTIQEALLTQSNQTFKPLSIDYDDHDDVFSFNFEREVQIGKASLNLKYQGVHNDVMDGFYRGRQQGRDGKERFMVSTKFEPIACRKCLPCIDEPAKKATFACSLEVDKGLTVLGNMPELKRESVSETREMVYFETSPIMSTYLLAFVVGEFDFIEATTAHDVKLRVYTPVGKTSLGEFALDCGTKALDLYDEMFGKPFPLPKMDMIGIPEFASGAMENWGLVTYRETALLLSEDASSSQRERVATVVTHELAHMWFGNLVTMRWWDDLWLNEGFATWMQNFAADKLFPDWQLWEQFVVFNQGSALSLDAMQSSHPVQVRIDRAQDAGQIFDLISYQKGSCVVRLAYEYLGEKDFKAGLQLYMSRHEYQNTETVDLWSAWEEASKKPVNNVMASWTEQQGFPVIVVETATTENGVCTLSLKQEWFLADGSVPDARTWKIPMFLISEKGATSLDLYTEPHTKVSVPVGDKGWVKLNAGQVVPLHVNYTRELWVKLLDAVRNDELETIEVCGLLRDATALTKAKRLSPAVLINLIKSLKGTTNYCVWSVLDSSLKALNSALVGSKPHANFVKLAKDLLLTAFKEVGWEKQKGDSHLIGKLRGLLVAALVTFSKTDPEVFAVASEKFEYYLQDQDTEQLPAEYRSIVLRIVLANASDSKVFDKLIEMGAKLESSVQKRDIYLAIGFAHSAELKEKAMEWALSDAVKLQDYFFVFASVSLSGPEGVALAWKFFKTNFERISDKLSSASERMLGAGITYSTLGFNSVENAQDIENFFSTRNSRNERKVEQIIEGIRNRASFKDLLLGSEELAEALNM